VGLNR